MRLPKDAKDSKNFVDMTTFSLLDPRKQKGKLANQPSKPEVNYDVELTPEEAGYMDELGFSMEDIMLMRMFKSNTDQVTSGWPYRKQPSR